MKTERNAEICCHRIRICLIKIIYLFCNLIYSDPKTQVSFIVKKDSQTHFPDKNIWQAEVCWVLNDKPIDEDSQYCVSLWLVDDVYSVTTLTSFLLRRTDFLNPLKITKPQADSDTMKKCDIIR